MCACGLLMYPYMHVCVWFAACCAPDRRQLLCVFVCARARVNVYVYIFMHMIDVHMYLLFALSLMRHVCACVCVCVCVYWCVGMHEQWKQTKEQQQAMKAKEVQEHRKEKQVSTAKTPTNQNLDVTRN